MAALLAGFLLVPSASANPPSDMSISYNELSKDLRVTITHPVSNPQEHYIKEVIVTINGKVVTDSRYTSQPSPDTFTYTYPLPAQPGDDIEVTANCNLAGSKSSHLYGTTTAAPTGAASGPTPTAARKAAAGLAPVLCAAAIVLLKKIRIPDTL